MLSRKGKIESKRDVEAFVDKKIHSTEGGGANMLLQVTLERRSTALQEKMQLKVLELEQALAGWRRRSGSEKGLGKIITEEHRRSSAVSEGADFEESGSCAHGQHGICERILSGFVRESFRRSPSDGAVGFLR